MTIIISKIILRYTKFPLNYPGKRLGKEKGFFINTFNGTNILKHIFIWGVSIEIQYTFLKFMTADALLTGVMNFVDHAISCVLIACDQAFRGVLGEFGVKEEIPPFCCAPPSRSQIKRKPFPMSDSPWLRCRQTREITCYAGYNPGRNVWDTKHLLH